MYFTRRRFRFPAADEPMAFFSRIGPPALVNYASAFVAQWIERSPPKG